MSNDPHFTDDEEEERLVEIAKVPVQETEQGADEPANEEVKPEDIVPEFVSIFSPIKGAQSFNQCLEEFNILAKEWHYLSGPILKYRSEVLELCKIDLGKKANIKHVVIGTLISYMVTGVTFENLKQRIKY
jgi:hypothetical protein